MAKIIIVSNRLPVKAQQRENELVYKASEGGLATGLSSVCNTQQCVWVGWPGAIVASDQRDKVRQSLSDKNLVPVFLSKKEIREFYEGFSNETLWPTFHYFPQYAVFQTDFWETYKTVNQRFCDEVLRIAEPGDTIWVQDYQLLLLPQMIRERLPHAAIGFFLHIPFPSYEIFRLLPWRVELLRGMLGADLVGFHTFDFMRHFLSAVSHILGLGNTGGHIELEDRVTVVDAFPLGIDYDKYAEAAASPAALEHERKFRKSIGPVKCILSIDRLDYSKGIAQRLEAFRKFLERYPEFREKVVLVQIVVPSRDKVERYNDLKEEVNRLVGAINAEYRTYQWSPIAYFYRSFPLDALAAFYRTSEVALVSPMRDGMNLVCKEYVASRVNQDGVLILSEMAGAIAELWEAVSINPNDIDAVCEAMHAALVMPIEEQRRRMQFMQSLIRKFNIQHWVTLFMDRLQYASEKRAALHTRKLDQSTQARIKRQFDAAKNRLILLDYDGTLVPFCDEPQHAVPDDDLIGLLQHIGTPDGSRLVIISGRDHHTLGRWLGSARTDLIAEHGVWLKSEGAAWEMISTLRDDWKPAIRTLLEQYSNRTPGAFIEEKDFALVWHYRKVARGLGELRSRELINHLKYLVSNIDLQVLEGDKVVEIKSVEVNKGKAALRWIKRYEPDFILAIGDDWTDEDIFKVMPPEAVTVRVRSSFSAAKYSLGSYKDVRLFLERLIGHAPLET